MPGLFQIYLAAKGSAGYVEELLDSNYYAFEPLCDLLPEGEGDLFDGIGYGKLLGSEEGLNLIVADIYLQVNLASDILRADYIRCVGSDDCVCALRAFRIASEPCVLDIGLGFIGYALTDA